jgi:hypothetical protein
MEKVSMEPFEREAMNQLVLHGRAVASMLGTDDGHGRKMAIWAQIVEDWLEKLDGRKADT